MFSSHHLPGRYFSQMSGHFDLNCPDILKSLFEYELTRVRTLFSEAY